MLITERNGTAGYCVTVGWGDLNYTTEPSLGAKLWVNVSLRMFGNMDGYAPL